MMNQIATGLVILVLLVAGTALIPVEYPPDDEGTSGGIVLSKTKIGIILVVAIALSATIFME